MRVLRRTPAALVLLLQLAVGARPLVGVSQPDGAVAEIHHGMVTATPDCHRAEAEAATSQTSNHAHDAAHATVDTDSESLRPSDEPASNTPSTDHGSHVDASCHGAPCCAPVVPTRVIRSVAILDAPVARQRPVTGEARIVFADGARRRPPATAPPAA